MHEELCARVCAVNQAIGRERLALHTWGNASGIDRAEGVVAIKPSGVAYEALTPNDIVLVDLDGAPLRPGLKPSVDLATHLALYRAFDGVGGIVHTHSHFAVCWAQARRAIPCLGTTHADYFHRDIPVARALLPAEMDDYEAATGRAIVECFGGHDPLACPGVLAAGHAPFAWGKTVEAAFEHAGVLEEVARMAWHTLALAPSARALEEHVLSKHYERKHGAEGYYGQG